jgi:hypothetical protein
VVKVWVKCQLCHIFKKGGNTLQGMCHQIFITQATSDKSNNEGHGKCMSRDILIGQSPQIWHITKFRIDPRRKKKLIRFKWEPLEFNLLMMWKVQVPGSGCKWCMDIFKYIATTLNEVVTGDQIGHVFFKKISVVLMLSLDKVHLEY